MLVGYMWVSSDGKRQTTDLQRDALLGAGVDERHLFEDYAGGSRDDRPGLALAQFEGALARKRVKAGLDAAQRRGCPPALA